MFHLEQVGEKKFNLYPVKELKAMVDYTSTDSNSHFSITNPYSAQPFQFSIQLTGDKEASVSNITLQFNNGKVIRINTLLSVGQYIICKGNKLFVADNNRNKISDIEVNEIPILAVGKNEVKLELLSQTTQLQN